MEFIKIILQNSNLKEAKLYNAALKANNNPEIGIVINNKAAYHVIKDCAGVALHYLPHLVFGEYQNPFESLKGKFTKAHLIEFIKASETNAPLNQLLHIIVNEAKEAKLLPASAQQPAQQPFNPEVYDPNALADPYGEYGVGNESAGVQTQPQTPTVNESPLEILVTAFGVTR